MGDIANVFFKRGPVTDAPSEINLTQKSHTILFVRSQSILMMFCIKLEGFVLYNARRIRRPRKTLWTKLRYEISVCGWYRTLCIYCYMRPYYKVLLAWFGTKFWMTGVGQSRTWTNKNTSKGCFWRVLWRNWACLRYERNWHISWMLSYLVFY